MQIKDHSGVGVKSIVLRSNINAMRRSLCEYEINFFKLQQQQQQANEIISPNILPRQPF